MAKKPFSIRIEPYVSNRFKALATVKNMDSAKMLSEMISKMESELNDNEKAAFDALLNVWKEED